MRENRSYYDPSNERGSIGKAAIFVKIALILTIVMILVISLNMLLQYSRLLQEKETLEAQISDCKEDVEELEYLIDAPMDEDYIIRVARRKLGLVLPEETVYHTDVGN